MFDFIRYVKCVFIVHVGGTRCVTSGTVHTLNIHARITWTVEVIRVCIFFMCIVCANTKTSMIKTNLVSMFSRSRGNRTSSESSVSGTGRANRAGHSNRTRDRTRDRTRSGNSSHGTRSGNSSGVDGGGSGVGGGGGYAGAVGRESFFCLFFWPYL